MGKGQLLGRFSGLCSLTCACLWNRQYELPGLNYIEIRCSLHWIHSTSISEPPRASHYVRYWALENKEVRKQGREAGRRKTRGGRGRYLISLGDKRKSSTRGQTPSPHHPCVSEGLSVEQSWVPPGSPPPSQQLLLLLTDAFTYVAANLLMRIRLPSLTYIKALTKIRGF